MERSKYKVIDIDNYYRKDVFKHFSEDCKCSTSITSKINVTKLVKYSKDTQTKFYINFLYILSKVLNSRDDYKMQYDYKSNKLIVYEKINPKHYIFHEDTETFTIVYSEFNEDYEAFYKNCLVDIENAKKTRNYGLDNSYENYFDASYIVLHKLLLFQKII
ncbi:CatA-like O-acetyltransferase [uncultured Clostridium sp.]|uniref:CatA-like O-acetyltransferase n=1 Tax=uncultured Clostridium sp. TaxID=59620 RepID=UPI003438C4D3